MSVGMSVLFEFDAGRGVVCADVRVPHRASFSSLDVFAECPGRWAGSSGAGGTRVGVTSGVGWHLSCGVGVGGESSPVDGRA